jgi:hypothetical protein
LAHRIGWGGAGSSRWRKNGHIGDFYGKGGWWLTAPIRNEPPRYRRLIGTKTHDSGANAEWITKNPYLKRSLKTIENRLPISRMEVVPDLKSQLPVTPTHPLNEMYQERD